ncbi:hypothetical protein S245_062307 [Arachis hypogaea]|nr:uncharacterized protein DS421_18g607940 [Arachis hypogaea]
MMMMKLLKDLQFFHCAGSGYAWISSSCIWDGLVSPIGGIINLLKLVSNSMTVLMLAAIYFYELSTKLGLAVDLEIGGITPKTHWRQLGSDQMQIMKGMERLYLAG